MKTLTKGLLIAAAFTILPFVIPAEEAQAGCLSRTPLGAHSSITNNCGETVILRYRASTGMVGLTSPIPNGKSTVIYAHPDWHLSISVCSYNEYLAKRCKLPKWKNGSWQP